MNKILLTILCILPFAFSASAKELSSFTQLMEALKKGEDVKAVFYYKDCQLISDNEISDRKIDAIGGMPMDTWEFFAKGAIRNKQAFVVASNSKLIANPIGDGFVYNYVKVKVSEDGVVKITAIYLDAVTKEIIMSENFFTEIHSSKSGAAHFFSK